ncbi:hypothetical protein COCON_G00177070 [Conger conger]|uniref:Uncharacterized protein n=1 Tax=Conger conger TaxID=82655 RepID=A0A9Q1D4R8_CONCO|nr:hypothetical protein COCON_G00177070 [Conger conger]
MDCRVAWIPRMKGPQRISLWPRGMRLLCVPTILSSGFLPACSIYTLTLFLDLPFVLFCFWTICYQLLDFDSWIVFGTVACLDCLPVLGLLPAYLTTNLITVIVPVCRYSTTACLIHVPSNKDICFAEFWVAVGSHTR